jgi:hypothetical protein
MYSSKTLKGKNGNLYSIMTINYDGDGDVEFERYGGKYVCIYKKNMMKEEGIIIYWEPIYNGFRGTCEDCTNWPES